MSAIFGKTYKINRVVTGTPDVYYQLGGTILEGRYDVRPTVNEEVGSDTGRTLASQKVVAVKPMIDFTMNVRVLADYLTAYAFITANGAVPAHTLYCTDGTETFKLTDAKVDKARITINQNDPIKAAISVLAKAYATATAGTFLFKTDPAMYKDAVTTLTIGGAPVLKWRDIEISVDNNVLQEILGTTIAPAEVEEQEARYEITITRAKPAASLIADAYAGTSKTVVIALVDKQGSPVTKTLTFTDALISTSELQDRELGIIYEKIVCKAKSVTIA
jgi:hypothetical protein